MPMMMKNNPRKRQRNGSSSTLILDRKDDSASSKPKNERKNEAKNEPMATERLSSSVNLAVPRTMGKTIEVNDSALLLSATKVNTRLKNAPLASTTKCKVLTVAIIRFARSRSASKASLLLWNISKWAGLPSSGTSTRKIGANNATFG